MGTAREFAKKNLEHAFHVNLGFGLYIVCSRTPGGSIAPALSETTAQKKRGPDFGTPVRISYGKVLGGWEAFVAGLKIS